MKIEPKLLELSDLATLGGAVLAVLAVTNTLAYVFRLKARWTGLIVAVVVSCIPVDEPSSWKSWILAGLNACIIYVTAAGFSSIGSDLKSINQESINWNSEENHGHRYFWIRWFV